MSGGVLLLLGPTGIATAAVAGFGADVLAGYQMRSLNTEELRIAQSVFDHSLRYDRIRITNAGDDRARTFALFDGWSLIDVGIERYEDMSNSSARRKTLVHELVHAWQIRHTPKGPEYAVQALTQVLTDDDTKYDPEIDAIRAWEDLHYETQAATIAFWYEIADGAGGVDDTIAISNSIYRYVVQNLRPPVA